VQALVAFPQAVLMLGQDIAWVQKLGDAFLAQPNDVMAMAQELRARRSPPGNLKSNEYQKVSDRSAHRCRRDQQTIVIESSQSRRVYVPSYNPTVRVRRWGYPSYPPYYYPPSAYWYPGAALAGGLAWGIGIGISGGIWGDCNWGGGDVNINSNRYNEFNRNIDRGDRQRADRGGRWQHDGARRDGVPYRDQAQPRQVRQSPGRRGIARQLPRRRCRPRSQSREQARQSMERQGMEPARDNQQARDRAQHGVARSAFVAGRRRSRRSRAGRSSNRVVSAKRREQHGLARRRTFAVRLGYGSRNNAFSGAGNSGASRSASNRGSSSRSAWAVRVRRWRRTLDEPAFARWWWWRTSSMNTSKTTRSLGTAGRNARLRVHRVRATGLPHARRRGRRARRCARPDEGRPGQAGGRCSAKDWKSYVPVGGVDRKDVDAFLTKYREKHAFEARKDGRQTARRRQRWLDSFPMPLTKDGSGWHFDLPAGQDEIRTRRIGRNELDVAQIVRAYHDAQMDYAESDRDGDGVLEYAQKFLSTDGQHDGLYWADDDSGQISPLGPLFGDDTPKGIYHGYRYRILTAQGRPRRAARTTTCSATT
jgi:hypothetical protein